MHNALCAQIEHKISEVLLSRGDYGFVGELGSLRDKLNAVRKEAKQLARVHQHQEGIVPLHDGRIGDRSIRELSARSYNAENLFFDSPDTDELRSNFRRDGDRNLFRIDLACNNANTRPVMACGQGTMNGPSPARLAAPQVLRPIDVSDPKNVEIDFS